MKKCILLFVLMLACFSAKSQQSYVGGTLALQLEAASSDGHSDSATAFGISPEVGHYFLEKVAVGVTVPMTFSSDITTVGILPYVRYDFAQASIVDFFGELALGWGYIHYYGDGVNGFEVGLRPGLRVNLSDKFALVARTTLLGFNHYDGLSRFGFALNNGFELGAVYKF